jgi:hypothetical protein
MSLFAGHSLFSVYIERLDLLPPLEGGPIFISLTYFSGQPHLLLQQSGDILGNGEIFLCSLTL